MEQTLSDRDRAILGAVVEEFIQHGELVGSRHLTKKCRFDLSPATVRNVMADLEELGFLVQPHTSAGRRPTDRGYRYYVDHLLEAEPLPPPERRRLRRQLAPADRRSREELLESACRTLSASAGQVGVVMAPRFDVDVFRRIDFVLLREHRVLVILVSQHGAVHHYLIEAPEVRDQGELDQMANYLNGLLADLPLTAVKERVLREMATDKALYDSLLAKALALGSRALTDRPTEGEVYLGDPSALLGNPEFSTVDTMRSLFEAFEKKGLILRLLDRAAEARNVQIVIGTENPVPDLRGCAMVSAAYAAGPSVQGALGVIGPTRMDYGRLVGLVGYAARLVGEALETL